mmetsp:Transcript_39151/g.99209  ORF Transcript_39151/g.99209 Transcript_39151/m.99209 type:complete len:309 (+) Transcript_39151:1836-2762(+)
MSRHRRASPPCPAARMPPRRPAWSKPLMMQVVRSWLLRPPMVRLKRKPPQRRRAGRGRRRRTARRLSQRKQMTPGRRAPRPRLTTRMPPQPMPPQAPRSPAWRPRRAGMMRAVSSRKAARAARARAACFSTSARCRRASPWGSRTRWSSRCTATPRTRSSMRGTSCAPRPHPRAPPTASWRRSPRRSTLPSGRGSPFGTRACGSRSCRTTRAASPTAAARASRAWCIRRWVCARRRRCRNRSRSSSSAKTARCRSMPTPRPSCPPSGDGMMSSQQLIGRWRTASASNPPARIGDSGHRHLAWHVPHAW